MTLSTHPDSLLAVVATAVGACRRLARTGRSRADRGQSEVIAVVLLTGVVILGTSVIFVYGGAAIDGRQTTAAHAQAERGFEQLDARTSRVALGDASVQQIDVGLVDNQGHLHSDDSGWIRVSVEPEGGTAVEVTNTTFGTVFYRRGDTVIAYQGGGVWRTDGEGSTLLSRPEFHYNEKTLTLPVVAVDGEPGLADRVQVAKNGPSERAFPDPANNLTNKIESGTVTVTVQSDFYDAWGRYFEETVGGLVTYDHPAEQVTVTFFGLPDIRGLDTGIIATSDTGELRVEGTGAYVDSYDSSQGDYAATQSADGLIRSAGNITMNGDALVDGDVEVGGSIDLVNNNNDTMINGSVAWTEEPAPDATDLAKIAGDVRRIDGVDSVPPINSFVTAYAARIRSTHDNNQTPHITSNVLDIPGSSAELGPGDYYLHNLDLDGETLVLNTTDGNIRIAVRDWVRLESGNVSVVGNGTVQLAVESQSTVTVSPTGLGSRDVHFHVGKGSDVFVPGQNSNRFVVFGPSHFASTIAGSSGNGNEANFVGVIFAPAGTSGPGSVYVKQANVYGLVMTGNLTAGQFGAIHYDRGLQNSLTDGSPLSELDYLHVAIHRVRVTSR